MYGLPQRTVGCPCQLALRSYPQRGPTRLAGAEPPTRALFWMDPPRPWVPSIQRWDEHRTELRMEHKAGHASAGAPRRVSVKGTEGGDGTVIVKTYRGKVWMSMPPFIWEATLDPAKVDELMHVLGLAREEATKYGNDSPAV